MFVFVLCYFSVAHLFFVRLHFACCQCHTPPWRVVGNDGRASVLAFLMLGADLYLSFVGHYDCICVLLWGDCIWMFGFCLWVLDLGCHVGFCV